MAERRARWLIGALAACVMACAEQEKPEATDVGGGSTEDFNGNLVSCSLSERVPIERSDEGVRFAPLVQQVRALIEGDYTVPFAWVRPGCRDAGPIAEDAGVFPIALQELLGTETMLHIGIHATGEDAIVWHDGNDDLFSGEEHSGSRCGQQLRIPATYTMKSDDGVLDEELTGEIWSESGRSAGTSGRDRASALRGSLSRQLSARSTAEFYLSAWLEQEGGTTFDPSIYVIADQDAAAPNILIVGRPRDAKSCHGQGVPRDSVLD